MRFGNAIRVRDGLATELVNRPSLDEARDALSEEQPAADRPARSPTGERAGSRGSLG
jgi:hypothetical protein